MVEDADVQSSQLAQRRRIVTRPRRREKLGMCPTASRAVVSWRRIYSICPAGYLVRRRRCWTVSRSVLVLRSWLERLWGRMCVVWAASRGFEAVMVVELRQLGFGVDLELSRSRWYARLRPDVRGWGRALGRCSVLAGDREDSPQMLCCHSSARAGHKQDKCSCL
jgi:hypothetical protein